MRVQVADDEAVTLEGLSVADIEGSDGRDVAGSAGLDFDDGRGGRDGALRRDLERAAFNGRIAGIGVVGREREDAGAELGEPAAATAVLQNFLEHAAVGVINLDAGAAGFDDHVDIFLNPISRTVATPVVVVPVSEDTAVEVEGAEDRSAATRPCGSDGELVAGLDIKDAGFDTRGTQDEDFRVPAVANRGDTVIITISLQQFKATPKIAAIGYDDFAVFAIGDVASGNDVGAFNNNGSLLVENEGKIAGAVGPPGAAGRAGAHEAHGASDDVIIGGLLLVAMEVNHAFTTGQGWHEEVFGQALVTQDVEDHARGIVGQGDIVVWP